MQIRREMDMKNKTKIGTMALLAIAVVPLLLDLDSPFTNSVTASASRVSWVGFDEGVKLSKESGKKMLVDVYTDWCTWCKKMDSEVYTAPEVQSAIEKHFVAVKLNAESAKTLSYKGTKMTETQFSRSAGVTGYPATLFMNETHEPITIVPGFISSDRFALILRYVGEDHYKTTPFQNYLSERGSTH